MTEGSVFVDDGFSSQDLELADDDVQEESTEEVVEPEESEESDDSKESEEVQLTEKGTKLDPNPKSAVHQELANARRQIQQMEQVLGSPDLLKQYAERSGLTLTEAKKELKEEKKEIQEFSADSFKNAEDIANAMNSLKREYYSEIESLKEENNRLRQGYEGINSVRRAEQVEATLAREVNTVQSKYPELNPQSPNYDPDLEQEIAVLYQDLDFDQQSQTYRGSVSLEKLTDRIMSAAQKARKAGSQEAQTNVKVKQAGKVVTNNKKKSESTESDDPDTAIAQKIAAMFG